MRYYFIVNPQSGGGRGKKIWAELKPLLEARGADYQLIALKYRGAARKAAEHLSGQSRPFTAVIIGGDGTIDEFIDGLSSFAQLTLGCIPTGSGNDFVRGLGLEKDPVKALEAILAPAKIRALKVGRVQVKDRAHSFIVSSGIGFDADVCNGAYSSGVKRFLNYFHIGKLIYLTTALGLLIPMRQYPMELTVQGAEESCYENCYESCYESRDRAAECGETAPQQLRYAQTFFAAVMNLGYEGGGFHFAPDADPESGCFQLIIAEGLTRLRILRLLPLALIGRHAGKKGVHILPCRRIEIRAGKPLCVHTDGEILGFYDHAVFETLPEPLRVITG